MEVLKGVVFGWRMENVMQAREIVGIE